MEESEGVEQDFAGRCREALVSAVRECKSRFPSCAILLSGGVDTAAILEANQLLRTDSIVIENAVTVLTADCEAFDRPYAGVVSRRHQLQNHTLVDVPLDTFLQFAPLCIRALRTFDGMTLRNSLVIAAGMAKCKELGSTVVMTGDGADELLGGYSYMWATSDPLEWKKKRDAQASRMTFATDTLAEAIGVKAISPYLQPSFINFALSETDRNACIADLPMELKPSEPSERILHTTGKVCLRLAFPESGSAFRRKDPIEVGSGCSTAHIDEHFRHRVSEEEFQREKCRVYEQDRVVLVSPEHMFYYRIFTEVFPNGLDDIDRFGSDPCTGCGYQIRSPEENFCHICGAWPARAPIASNG